MDALRKAAEQALEAFTSSNDLLATMYLKMDAVTALRAALAEQEQEQAAQVQEPWSTPQSYFKELNDAVREVRRAMQVRTVTMRTKTYDVALPILDFHPGHVLVGEVKHCREQDDAEIAELRAEVERLREVLIYSLDNQGRYLKKHQKIVDAALKEPK
jgi:hypothetical protein